MDDFTNNLLRDLQKSVSAIGQKMGTREDLARLETKIDTRIERIDTAIDTHAVAITTLENESESTRWLNRTLIAAVLAIIISWANSTWHIIGNIPASASTAIMHTSKR